MSRTTVAYANLFNFKQTWAHKFHDDIHERVVAVHVRLEREIRAGIGKSLPVNYIITLLD